MAEENKKYFDLWGKYVYGLYALPLLAQKDMGGIEGLASRYLHIEKSRGSESFAREMAENPKKNLANMLEEDAGQYYKLFSELTVEEALKHVCDVTGYNSGFSPALLKFQGKKIGELEESAEKYEKATKAYLEAKTPEEAAKAKAEQLKYEELSKAFETVRMYDMLKVRQKVIADITREAIRIDQIKNYGLKEAKEKKAA